MQDVIRISIFRFQITCFLLCFVTLNPLFADTNWTTLPARADDQPGFIYHPSPTDWRNATIYQIITDRFYDGDTANNSANPNGAYNPLSMDGIHGGDFVGITKNLDYIQYLGFNTIWISPVLENFRGVYHGYHIINFNAIDPHWGTLEELRELVDQAHARGMYVIIDVVFNHMARMTVSDDEGFPRFSKEPYKIRWFDEGNKFAPPLDDLSFFHAHGSINDWEDEEQNVIGELRGLADLKTEDPRVRELLLESHLALIAATDCDGFRVDTAHHVELDFWKNVLPDISAGAAELGKTNFLMFAEALRHRDDHVSYLTREGEFPSALYYPYYFTLKGIWSLREPTSYITGRWKHRHEYGEQARDQLITFGDNHDNERLLNEKYLNGDYNRLKALLTHLYASPGIPCVYYGTEQGFSGAKGHGAREPMFDPTKPENADHMDATSEISRWIRNLNLVRDQYPVLKDGKTRILHEEGKAGLFAFERMTSNKTALVVLNNSVYARTIKPGQHANSLFKRSATWTELLTGNTRREDESITVPADTTQIWIPTEQVHQLPLSILTTEPKHGSVNAKEDEKVSLTFDRSITKPDAIMIEVNKRPVDYKFIHWTNEYRQASFALPPQIQNNPSVEWTISHPDLQNTFASRFTIGNPGPNVKYPMFIYQADGLLDATATRIASNNHEVSLHISYDEKSSMLYLATKPATAKEDRFIMVAFSNHESKVSAPWNKHGNVPGYDILISDEGESDYTSIRGTKEMNWSTSDKDGVFEAAIHIQPSTENIHLQTGTYETWENGKRVAAGSIPAEAGYISIKLENLISR